MTSVPAHLVAPRPRHRLLRRGARDLLLVRRRWISPLARLHVVLVDRRRWIGTLVRSTSSLSTKLGLDSEELWRKSLPPAADRLVGGTSATAWRPI
ncbi:hypothetical protein ACMHYB_38470 [Sorangium sp. So ce1128]